MIAETTELKTGEKLTVKILHPPLQNYANKVILRNDFAKCLSEDGCHMTAFGNEVLSDAVVEAIRSFIRGKV